MTTKTRIDPTLQRAARLQLARSNFGDFTRYTFPRLVENWHHTLLLQEVDKALRFQKANRHLIVVTPPRHGKSEIVSRRAPAFALGKYPELEIIQATYSEDLASKMGRDVLKILDDPSYKEVFPDFQYGEKRTHIEITTDKGGTAKFVGVGGGVTGRGANIVIVDDPFKSREEAESRSSRNRVWDWFNDDLMTRLEYPYCVIVTHTRWHLDDLAGRLLSREPEKWKLVHLPLIADYDQYDTPWPDYDPRSPGGVLWPEVRLKGKIQFDAPEDVPTVKELTHQIQEDYKIRMQSNPYGVLSLDQGRPIHKEGNLMRRSWFGTYSSEPHIMAKYCKSIVISVDSNFKKDAAQGSHVALIVMGLKKDNSIVVLDAHWERMGFVDTKAAAERMLKKWPTASFLIESKANGDALIDTLSELAASIVPFDPKNESKESRAHKLADVAEAGGIYLPEAEPWTEKLLNILTTFPNGELDDPVDAMSQCVIRWDKRKNSLKHLRRVVGRKDPEE
jgi:predicted phage terminase large subunit-like protein